MNKTQVLTPWMAVAIIHVAMYAIAQSPLAGADRSGTDDEWKTMKPGWVFATGFEETNVNNLWQNFDRHTVLVNDPGPLNLTNNTVMRFRVDPGKRGGAGLVKVLPGFFALLALSSAAFRVGANNQLLPRRSFVTFAA